MTRTCGWLRSLYLVLTQVPNELVSSCFLLFAKVSILVADVSASDGVALALLLSCNTTEVVAVYRAYNVSSQCTAVTHSALLVMKYETFLCGILNHVCMCRESA